jgi:hypothetical protein
MCCDLSLFIIQHSRMSNQGIRDISVPSGVFLVPSYCLSQSFLPRHLFGPTELVQLRRIDGVTQVVESAVGDEFNPLFFFMVQSKAFEQSLCNHNVRNFIVSADIVNMTWRSFMPAESEKDKNWSVVSIDRCYSANCCDNNENFLFPLSGKVVLTKWCRRRMQHPQRKESYGYSNHLRG